ncbi:MAG: PEGA domain-containing protein [Pyrinomonadaceae bacterium]
MRVSMAPTKFQVYGKLAFASLLVLTVFSVPTSTAYASRKLAKYGTIKVQTNPAGLPIEVDGRPEGNTTSDWRAWDKDPGVHTVVISLPNGQRWTREISLEAGRIKCVTLNYRPGPPPVAKSPCPFPVNLSAPTSVNEGEVITYTADVTYAGASPLNYTWTVSPASAKILSGPGTPTVTVDSTGFAGQRITATLVVDDGSGETTCRQVAQAATFIPQPPPRENPAREYDVCCSCSYDDQKARLDNLAVELQNDPSATAYVFAYGGRTSRAGQADRLGSRAREYLVSERGINTSRIVVINGGFREEDCVELWIVPAGATAPQPRPTVQPGEVRPAPEAPSRRRRP